MKKLYALLVLTLCLFVGVSANAQTVVFDFAANPWNHALGSGSGETAAAGDVETLVATGGDAATGAVYEVELVCVQGTANQPPRMWTGPQLRVYNGNTLTLKPTDSSKAVVGVTFTATGANYYNITTNVGTLEETNWTGNHTEVTFTGTGTSRLTQMTVVLADKDNQTVTPGATVTMPSISPRNNTNRTDSVVVTITGDETTAIYYTIDGSDPTEKSLPYTGPFTLKESATVKAIAFNTEGVSSSIAEVTYTITPSEQGGGTGEETDPSGTTTGKEYLFAPALEMTSGKQYLIVAQVDNTYYMAKPITSNYGYLKVDEVTKMEDGMIVLNSLDNAFTISEVSGAAAATYTITQSDGRQLYQKGTYTSFNVDAAPTEGQGWFVSLIDDVTTWTITNASVNKYVQYSTTHKSFGSYADEQGLLPQLYVLYQERDVTEEGGGGQTDPTEDTEYTTVTFPFSENPWQLELGSQGNDKAGAISEPITMEGVTFTADNGGGSTVVRMWDNNGNVTMRTYNGTAITFAVTDATQAIYKLEFDANGMNYTSEIGSVDVNGKTWTGNASSVTLAANKTTQVKTVTVYLGARTDETVVPGVYVAAPVISPSAGEKNDSVTVSIKAGEGSYIYYTLDGTDPTWNSQLYSEPFKLYETTTVKAIAYDDEGNPSQVTEAVYTITITEHNDPDPVDEGVIFSDAATNSTTTQLVVNNVVLPEQLTSVWRFDSRYGAVASGYYAADKANLATEAVLITPVLAIPALDASNPEVKPTLSFEHAIGYVAASLAGGYMELAARVITIESTDAGVRSLKATTEWKPLTLTFPELNEGKNFSNFEEVEIDLSEYAGQNIELGFIYKSTTEVAPTWEVRNIEVTCRKKEATGIEAITVAPTQGAAVYDLQGRRVMNPARGIYIVGGRKVYIK